MFELINRLNRFNHTNVGVITGLILGLAMLSMGISFFINYIQKKDFSTIWVSLVVCGIGISTIVVEIHRWKKIRKKGDVS